MSWGIHYAGEKAVALKELRKQAREVPVLSDEAEQRLKVLACKLLVQAVKAQPNSSKVNAGASGSLSTDGSHEVHVSIRPALE